MRSIIFISLLVILQSSGSLGTLAISESGSDNKASVCLSSEEKKLYDMIMAYRKSKGLDPISLSARLTQVAQVHARDLATNYKFDPDNKCNPHSWSSKGKWTSCCYTSDHKKAECMWNKPKEIAGYESPGYEIAYYSSAGATAAEGLEGWKRSPAHNPLIINDGIWKKANWKGIGIGLYQQYGVVWFGELEDTVPIENCPDSNPNTSRPRSEKL